MLRTGDKYFSAPDSERKVSTMSSQFDWFPLATEQLRLRSLSDVIVFSPELEHAPGAGEEVADFYLTFHDTPLSPSFFTSAPAKPLDKRAAWSDLEQKMEFGGVKSVIVRLWANVRGRDRECRSESVTVWGVTFSGLVCVGDKIPPKIAATLRPNSLVFKLHNHYFVCNECLQEPVPQLRFVEVPNMILESCKSSYDRASLLKLASTLRALKQIELSNGEVKRDISARLDPGPGGKLAPALASVSSSLRQQIFSVKPKQPATKMAEVNLAVKIENTRCRLALLKQEKERLQAVIDSKKEERDKSLAVGDEVNNNLMEKYHTLSKLKEELEIWCKSFQESRECNKKTKVVLQNRRRQLISQLGEIFPIQYTEEPHPTICHVVVPRSDPQVMRERDDTDLAVGLGWVAHLATMVSSLLAAPLRYPVLSAGSRSQVRDDILMDRAGHPLPDKERDFPLYAKGVERIKFDYGVWRLNQNVSQLRWLCDLETTKELQPCTLRSLAGLISSFQPQGPGQSPAETVAPARHQLPSGPPGTAAHLSSFPNPSSVGRRRRTAKSPQLARAAVTTTSSEAETEQESGDTAAGDGAELRDTAETERHPAAPCTRDQNSDDTVTRVHEPSGEIKTPDMETTLPEDVKIHTNGNGDCPNEVLCPEAASDHPVEEGVEATGDMDWDTVADRTQALAVPNTFRRQLTRPF